jgi:PHD/YefM family antitoxin component YafN of YafNO toxin-antitoxin module
MNAIPANELKRHGISAIEKLLANGPVHVIKRNQPVCVVLAEEEYRQLTQAAQAASASPGHTVMEWFALYTPGTATKEEIDKRLVAEREEWDKP